MPYLTRPALLLALGLALAAPTTAQQLATTKAMRDDPKMKPFIDNLLGKMTLDEKIGQLNLVSVGFDVTGPVVSKDVDANIKKGNRGGRA